jgi:hypothetical protein
MDFWSWIFGQGFLVEDFWLRIFGHGFLVKDFWLVQTHEQRDGHRQAYRQSECLLNPSQHLDDWLHWLVLSSPAAHLLFDPRAKPGCTWPSHPFVNAPDCRRAHWKAQLWAWWGYECWQPSRHEVLNAPSSRSLLPETALRSQRPLFAPRDRSLLPAIS